jgi:phenylpropionate dioxygenase-like ring-hydroxylating dioxygenase large terminal subunit
MTLLQPVLPATAYIDQDWYGKERDLIFKRLWQFYGFASQFEKPNQFVAKKIFDIPIVVQNFNGELRAFENICLHRLAPIQTEPQGCRPLTCRYHGWNYGADGHVAAIPFEKEVYVFAEDAKQKMCLRRFGVERVGGLIFINLSDNPLPIEKQFSREFLDSLAGVSNHFDAIMETKTFHRRFNWKMIFENLRDGLHPSFLHRDTLYKNVKFDAKPPPVGGVEAYLAEPDAVDPYQEMQDYFSKGGPDTKLEKNNPAEWKTKVERYGSEDVYYNWLAFPNLHIASGDGGHAFIIEHYIPRGPGLTDVEVCYLTAKRKELIPEAEGLLQHRMRGAEDIFEEDFTILEQTQAGLHKDAPLPNWGAFEIRSHRISKWIARVVRDETQL